MSIVVPCSCGQQLATTPEMRGRMVACPKCGRMLVIGSSAGSAGPSMAGSKLLIIAGIGVAAVVAIGVIAVVASFAFSSRKPVPVASAPATTPATPSPAPAAIPGAATPPATPSPSPQPTQPAAPARSLVNVEPDIRINALDLALEWAKGPAAADAKYAGKVIEVEGAITEYGNKNYFENKDVNPQFVKVGKTEVLFKDVRCETAETDLRNKISLKSAVKIKGLWLPVPPPDTRLGARDITRERCTLVNCVFTEIGPNPRVTLTAEQMETEARTDRKQFDARYGDRATEITVTGGEVVSVEQSTYVLIVIKTSAPPRIVYMMEGDQNRNMAFAKSKLLPGTKVRIECTYNNEYTSGDTSDILLNKGSIHPEP
jgi:tRNA_anti-like